MGLQAVQTCLTGVAVETSIWTCCSQGGIETFLTQQHSITSKYIVYNSQLTTHSCQWHSIDVFFRCDPCGSRILHRPSFLSSMLLHPKDPNYPHSAVLHAIVCSASLLCPTTPLILRLIVRVCIAMGVTRCCYVSRRDTTRPICRISC